MLMCNNKRGKSCFVYIFLIMNKVISKVELFHLVYDIYFDANLIYLYDNMKPDNKLANKERYSQNLEHDILKRRFRGF